MCQLPDIQAQKYDMYKKNSKFLIFKYDEWLYLQNRYKLTTREKKIAELICQNLSDNHIATKLHIRVGTVFSHIRNICRKVRVKSKMGIVLRFVSDIKELSEQY